MMEPKTAVVAITNKGELRVYLDALGITPDDAIRYFSAPEMTWVKKVTVTRGATHKQWGRSVTITPLRGMSTKNAFKKLEQAIEALLGADTTVPRPAEAHHVAPSASPVELSSNVDAGEVDPVAEAAETIKRIVGDAARAVEETLNSLATKLFGLRR